MASFPLHDYITRLIHILGLPFNYDELQMDIKCKSSWTSLPHEWWSNFKSFISVSLGDKSLFKEAHILFIDEYVINQVILMFFSFDCALFDELDRGHSILCSKHG